MRWMWLENEATMTRPGASAKMPSKARPTPRSGLVKPGLLGVGAVGHQQQHALAAELGELLHARSAGRRWASGRA